MKPSKLPVKLSSRRGGSLPPAHILGSPSLPNLTGEREHPLLNATLSDDGNHSQDEGKVHGVRYITEDLRNHCQDEGKVHGVRYITEDLIKRVTKQDDLPSVQTLNLCGTKHDKKIKWIENLERCEKLQLLNLSHNIIQKMEKLDRLNRLRELDLSHNRIRKLEGLQHMGSLQLLNLSYNLIESVPLWLSKRLRSLTTLNLQDNSISSLHELCRLKSLVSLTQLRVCGNPLSQRPHHRPLLIYHLRALQLLDTQSVSQQEREEAHQRFHMEEVARLEQELEQRIEEVEKMQRECEAAVTQLHQQEAVYHSLQQHSQQQQQQHEELQTELDSKTELLKQKTVELSRGCQKHYALEQELAFLKIDAKFEPIPFYPEQDIDLDSGLSESPYIGKARHQRKRVATDEPDAGCDQPGPASRVASVTQTPGALSGCAEDQEEERLRLLQVEVKRLEQQIFSANQELHGLEETTIQKRVCEAERERIREHLLVKLQELKQDQAEVQSLETQLDTHSAQMARAQTQLEILNDQLQSVHPSEPKHDHLKAQVSRQEQLLDIMSQRHQELETRLDYMITRIAKETQDIKDLEQQLTDGQILANDALKRELEDVISGLQEYLQGVRGQARRAQSDCHRLQSQNQNLQHLLQDREEQCRQLLDVQEELDVLRREHTQLSEAVRESGVCRSELEDRSSETDKLRAELTRLRSLTKVERAALEAELQNERQARDNAEVRVQFETENLMEHISSLKEESDALREEAAGLQAKLQCTSTVLIHPDDLLQRLQMLTHNLSADTPDTSVGPAIRNTAVEESLQTLQQEVWHLVREEREQEREKAKRFQKEREESRRLQEEREDSRRLQEERDKARRLQEERDESRRQQEALSGELKLLRQQLTAMQKQNQQQTREAAKKNSEHEMELQRLLKELQMGQGAELQKLREGLEEAQEVELQQLREELEETQEAELSRLKKKLREGHKAELQGLKEELQEAQEQQYLMSQRLQEAESEREGLLVELREQDTQAVEELKRSVCSADRAAGEQLTAVTQQLQTLYKAALRIRQQREQDAEQLEDSRQQVAQVAQDLEKAEAETVFLQRLLKDGPCVLGSKSTGGPASSPPQVDMEQLAKAIRRLTEQLNQASTDKSVSIEEVLDEMVALRDMLKQGSYVSSLQGSPRSGNWYYIPTGQSAASVASQGTQDSGLGSQFPSSPQRKPRPQHRPPHKRNHPKGAGYWLYSPHPPNKVGSESAGESDTESSAPWWFFPAGAVLHTSLPAQAPPAGSQCNLPTHQHMERDLRDAQRHLKEQSRLEQERKDLQREIYQLRRDHKRLRARLRSGAEKSVLEEVECLEETLQRRRAELREADRLLLHAHTQLKDTNTRSKELERCCGETQKRVCELQQEMEEMENRAQQCAKQLIHTKHQLSAEQEELQQLQHQRQNEERSLAATDTHHKQLSQRLEDNERLLEEAEDRLGQRKRELQSLDTELGALGRRVGQWSEEERVLQQSLQQHRDTLLHELTHGEEETHSLHTRIKELRVCVEALSQQKRDVEGEVCEGRSHLTVIRQEQQREEETLNKLISELKCVRDQRQEQEAQREQLQEKCRHLEARQRHAQRCLANAEKAVRDASTELARVHSELKQSRDTAEEMKRLSELLDGERFKLDAVRQAIRSASSERDDLLQEQLRLRGDVQATAERAQTGQSRLEDLELQLRELDSQLTHKHTQLRQHHEQQEWSEEVALQQQRKQQLQAQLQTLEGAVAERVQRMEHLTAEEAELQDKRRLLHTEEEQHRLRGQELCEWETKLKQQEQELEAQGEELDVWRCKVQRLQKLLKKQTHTVQEAQQVAKESEQRAHTLQTELHTLSQELQSVREKLFAQEEKQRRVCEGSPAGVCEGSPAGVCADPGDSRLVPELELEFPSITDTPHARDLLSPSPPSTEEGQLQALFTPSRTSALTTQDEQWRGELLREKLQQHEDELKAQLRRRMFDQQEALCVRRQQAEGSLEGLRRRVDWLDQLLGAEGTLEVKNPRRQVRLSNSWHSETSDPFSRPVRLDPSLPEREQSCALKHTTEATSS